MPVWRRRATAGGTGSSTAGEVPERGFKTKCEAKAAEAEHRKRRKQVTTPTPTGTDFKKTWPMNTWISARGTIRQNLQEKSLFYKSFQAAVGNLPLSEIYRPNHHRLSAGRPANSNYNKHRKILCAFSSGPLSMGLWRQPLHPCRPHAGPAQTQGDPHPGGDGQDPPGDRRIPPFFLALYSLAARLGEINNLRWEDVNFKREWSLYGPENQGWGTAPKKAMNQDLYEELSRLYNKRSGEYVFPNPETGLPYRNRRAQIRRPASMPECPITPGTTSGTMWPPSWPMNTRITSHTTEDAGAPEYNDHRKYVQSLGEGQGEAAKLLKIKTLPAPPPAKNEKG